MGLGISLWRCRLKRGKEGLCSQPGRLCSQLILVKRIPFTISLGEGSRTDQEMVKKGGSMEGRDNSWERRINEQKRELVEWKRNMQEMRQETRELLRVLEGRVWNQEKGLEGSLGSVDDQRTVNEKEKGIRRGKKLNALEEIMEERMATMKPSMDGRKAEMDSSREEMKVKKTTIRQHSAATCQDLQEVRRLSGGRHRIQGKQSDDNQAPMNANRSMRCDGEIRGGEGEQFNWRKRVELPVFEGLDPLNWINWAERFFEIQGVAEEEEEKVRLAYVSMEGSTGYWFRAWKEKARDRSWDGLKEALVIRFGTAVERLATFKWTVDESYEGRMRGMIVERSEAECCNPWRLNDTKRSEDEEVETEEVETEIDRKQGERLHSATNDEAERWDWGLNGYDFLARRSSSHPWCGVASEAREGDSALEIKMDEMAARLIVWEMGSCESRESSPNCLGLIDKQKREMEFLLNKHDGVFCEPVGLPPNGERDTRMLRMQSLKRPRRRRKRRKQRMIQLTLMLWEKMKKLSHFFYIPSSAPSMAMAFRVRNPDLRPLILLSLLTITFAKVFIGEPLPSKPPNLNWRTVTRGFHSYEYMMMRRSHEIEPSISNLEDKVVWKENTKCAAAAASASQTLTRNTRSMTITPDKVKSPKLDNNGPGLPPRDDDGNGGNGGGGGKFSGGLHLLGILGVLDILKDIEKQWQKKQKR
ncbi:hypothetical protein V8G54_027746 [Vigna mungo]|uniref:Retrotransposon gag domain-containing protein n=1 Tax=Vigna mungo TaxID=3915 RepID=A0AAQ3MRB1_VIGMU